MIHTRSVRRTGRAAIGGILLAGALVAAGAASAGAAVTTPTLYGATGVRADDTTPASNLYTLDPNTGAATTIGAIGHAITGLAVDPTDAQLYGVTAAVSESATQRQLLRINETTGAGTIVGSIGTNNIEDIAFNAQGVLFGWNETGDDLAQINKATGAVTPVGDSGLGVTFGDGMSFDKDGTLWAMLEGDFGPLSIVNPATGAVTKVDDLSGSPAKAPNGFPAGAMISAASFGCDGTTLHAVVNDFADPPTYLVTVNTANARITNKGTTVTALDAIAWACPAAVTPPAPPATDSARPRISVSGVNPDGCRRRSFTARVSVADDSALARVVVSLNGRVIKRSTASSFNVRVRIRTVRPNARHRLRVVAVDSSGNRSVTRRSFRRCATRSIQAPRFTG